MKNINDNYKWMMTPKDKLFWAIRNNNFWMVDVILEQEIDLATKKAEGVAPVEYATQLGYTKMAAFLQSKGARK